MLKDGIIVQGLTLQKLWRDMNSFSIDPIENAILVGLCLALLALLIWMLFLFNPRLHIEGRTNWHRYFALLPNHVGWLIWVERRAVIVPDLFGDYDWQYRSIKR